MAAVAIYVAAPVSDLSAFQKDGLAQAVITVSAEAALQISQNSRVIFDDTDNSESLKALQDGLFAGQAFVGFLAHFERSDIVQSARIVRQAHLLHGDMTDEELVSWTQNLLVVAISALNEPISDLQKNPSDFNP